MDFSEAIKFYCEIVSHKLQGICERNGITKAWVIREFLIAPADRWPAVFEHKMNGVDDETALRNLDLMKSTNLDVFMIIEITDEHPYLISLSKYRR